MSARRLNTGRVAIEGGGDSGGLDRYPKAGDLIAEGGKNEGGDRRTEVSEGTSRGGLGR